MGLYWVSYHTDFAESTEEHSRGEAVGLQLGLPNLAMIIGPVLGALIISMIGFTAIFIFASAIFGISIIPLFRNRQSRGKYTLRITNVFRNRRKTEALGMVGIGMKQMGNEIFWPIAIFLLLGSLLYLGVATTAMLLFMFVLNLVIGWLSDRYNSTIIMRIGGVLDSLVWITKTIVDSALSVFGISAIGGITESISNIPQNKKIYNRSKRGNTLEYLVFMRTNTAIGRVLILLMAFFIFSSNTQIGLFLSAIGAVGYLIF